MSDLDLATLRRAVAHSPTEVPCLLDLILAHDRRLEFTHAQRVARWTLVVAPRDEVALYLLARNSLFGGEFEHAARAFAELANRNSRYGSFERLVFFCVTDEVAKCLSLLNDLIKRPDLKAYQYLVLCRVAYAVSDRLIALVTQLLRKAIILEPNIVGPVETIGSYRYGTCADAASTFQGSTPSTHDECAPRSCLTDRC